jgi:hypothetical protein
MQIIRIKMLKKSQNNLRKLQNNGISYLKLRKKKWKKNYLLHNLNKKTN